MVQGTAHLLLPGSNHRHVFWKLPQTQFLCSQAKAAGSLQGPAWNPSGRLLLVRGTPCSDRNICALMMLFVTLHTAQMRTRASVVPLYTSLTTRPL